LLDGDFGNDRLSGDLGVDCFSISDDEGVVLDFSFDAGDHIELMAIQDFSLEPSDSDLRVHTELRTTILKM